MLWYKGWLETRIRLAVTVGFTSFFLVFLYSHPAHDAKVALGMVGIVSISTIWICALLAGAGIATQPAFQATKGLHGSMLFTLALPVNRFQLLAVRAGIGWLESTAVFGLFC